MSPRAWRWRGEVAYWLLMIVTAVVIVLPNFSGPVEEFTHRYALYSGTLLFSIVCLIGFASGAFLHVNKRHLTYSFGDYISISLFTLTTGYFALRGIVNAL